MKTLNWLARAAHERATDELFAQVVERGDTRIPQVAIAHALRPARALPEANRARMREAMLAAFDSACAGQERDLAPLGAPDVATAEVLTDRGRIVMADVESIDPDRAQSATDEALRYLDTLKGLPHGLGPDATL